MPNSSASEQTLLGFDFGLKRIGVAVGQTITASANPLTVLAANNGIPRWEEIKELIKTWRPTALVVGVPLNMDGSEQSLTTAAQNFAQNLRDRFQLTVHEIDERLSTKAARQHLFEQGGYRSLKKNTIDSFAAQLILETWLNNQK